MGKRGVVALFGILLAKLLPFCRLACHVVLACLDAVIENFCIFQLHREKFCNPEFHAKLQSFLILFIGAHSTGF
jgi:hypothetical protein